MTTSNQLLIPLQLKEEYCRRNPSDKTIPSSLVRLGVELQFDKFASRSIWGFLSAMVERAGLGHDQVKPSEAAQLILDCVLDDVHLDIGNSAYNAAASRFRSIAMNEKAEWKDIRNIFLTLRIIHPDFEARLDRSGGLQIRRERIWNHVVDVIGYIERFATHRTGNYSHRVKNAVQCNYCWRYLVPNHLLCAHHADLTADNHRNEGRANYQRGRRLLQRAKSYIQRHVADEFDREQAIRALAVVNFGQLRCLWTPEIHAFNIETAKAMASNQEIGPIIERYLPETSKRLKTSIGLTHTWTPERILKVLDDHPDEPKPDCHLRAELHSWIIANPQEISALVIGHELWQRLENEHKHGGTRKGAGRKRTPPEDAASKARESDVSNG